MEEGVEGSPGPLTPAQILDRFIDRKVVLELAQENLPARAEEADAFLESLVRSLGREAAAERLAEFGREWSNLRACIEEKIAGRTPPTSAASSTSTASSASRSVW